MSTEDAQEPIEDTVERIQQGVEAFNRRDIEGAMAPLDPDVELVPLRAVLEGGSYHGLDGLRRFLEDMGEDWEQFDLRADEFVPIGQPRAGHGPRARTRPRKRGGGRLRRRVALLPARRQGDPRPVLLRPRKGPRGGRELAGAGHPGRGGRLFYARCQARKMPTSGGQGSEGGSD